MKLVEQKPLQCSMYVEMKSCISLLFCASISVGTDVASTVLLAVSSGQWPIPVHEMLLL